MPTDLDVYAPERWIDDALFRPEPVSLGLRFSCCRSPALLAGMFHGETLLLAMHDLAVDQQFRAIQHLDWGSAGVVIGRF